MNKLFKDISNKIHEIEEGFEHLLPMDCIEITQTEADSLRAPTAEEIELARTNSITAHANDYVISRYSELKQRKYLSIAVALDDKETRLGLILTADELALLQTIRDVNTWITSVRTVENTAITNGTLLADIVWPV